MLCIFCTLLSLVYFFFLFCCDTFYLFRDPLKGWDSQFEKPWFRWQALLKRTNILRKALVYCKDVLPLDVWWMAPYAICVKTQCKSINKISLDATKCSPFPHLSLHFGKVNTSVLKSDDGEVRFSFLGNITSLEMRQVHKLKNFYTDFLW